MNLAIAESPMLQGIADVKSIIDEFLERDDVVILPPQDVKQTLALVRLLGYHFDTMMLDPWYNKGFGGMQDDYLPFFLDVIHQSNSVAEHVYFWGFPGIAAPFIASAGDLRNDISYSQTFATDIKALSQRGFTMMR